MPLCADCIGLELKTGIVPFICTRFEWQLQSELRRHPALGLSQGEMDRGVHFVQDSRFFKPIRPGMNLQARGRVSEIRTVRSGSLIAYDYTIEDTDARERLSASRSISIFRDVEIAPDSDTAQEQQRSAGQVPSRVASHTPSLTESLRVSIPVTRGFAHVYTECAHIWNPVHTERQVALAAGLPDIILHGTATWALAGRELLIAHGCEGRRMNRLAGRFVGHVIPPATLTLRYRPNDQGSASIHFDVLGANGVVVLADGLAEFSDET